jgi:acyl carrier protein
MSYESRRMDELEPRLVQCFSALFPDLSESDIPRADVSTVAGWDSVAVVTLLSLLEEEFNVTVDPMDVEKLTSFQSTLGYLRSKIE